MKKLMLLVVLLLIQALMPVMAEELEDGSYVVDMPNIQITFTPPEGMLCLTRETSASVFNRWGLSQREVFAYMEEWDIYAIMIDVGTGAEYQICAYPWDMIDYDDTDETQAQLICAATLKEMRETGYEVKTCDFYQNTGHAFVIVDNVYTYEDGYVEPELLLFTCQSGYEVDIYAYPAEGETTESVKAAAKALADSVLITPQPLTVTTEELTNGDFVLAVDDTKLTFTPMDIRFSLTRESGKYMFDKMGYDRDEELSFMEMNYIYAILYDRNQRARVQVHIYEEIDAPDYSEMTEWLMKAAENNRYVNYGWTVEKIEIFTGGALPFVKATVSCTAEEGTVDRRMIYGSYVEGTRLEIQVFASGEQILKMVEEQTDAFIRNIRAE